MIRLDTLFRNIRVFTVTLDFPSVGSNGTQVIDAPIANTPLGSIVNLVPLTDALSFDDLILQANVVTANSIRFIAHNPSGGAVNPASTDFALWTGEINTDLAVAL